MLRYKRFVRRIMSRDIGEGSQSSGYNSGYAGIAYHM